MSDSTQQTVMRMNQRFERMTRDLVAEQERVLESFVLSGAMPRDICLCLEPMKMRIAFPLELKPVQAWRVN